ncbi:MAG TPA: hypothetical protein PKK68_09350 [Methanothrix soehngenii]|nr:hypothetical protein [Methanothrix soehngenii]
MADVELMQLIKEKALRMAEKFVPRQLDNFEPLLIYRTVVYDKKSGAMRSMQRIWLIFLIILITGICTAQVPDLVGNWTGSATAYFVGDGAYDLVEDDRVTLIVVEQTDRLITGNITYMNEGEEIVEAFAGAIGADNKTFYIAESKGYGFGTIISDDEIEMSYLEQGKPAIASIDKFHRIKASSAH